MFLYIIANGKPFHNQLINKMIKQRKQLSKISLLIIFVSMFDFDTCIEYIKSMTDKINPLDFLSANAESIINKSFLACFITDMSDRIIWISRTFTKITGYSLDMVCNRDFRHMIHILKELKAEQDIICNFIIPADAQMEFKEFAYFYDWQINRDEGLHASLHWHSYPTACKVFFVEPLSRNPDTIHGYFHNELFAILDDDLKFVEFGAPCYTRLRQLHPEDKFRGAPLKSYIHPLDFKEWEKSRSMYREHVLLHAEESGLAWRRVFDNTKDTCSRLFPSKTKGVVFNENSIDLVPFQGNEIYCMMTRPLDFFQTAVRIKYRLPEGCGGVVFCGSPTPVTSPEENGYMLVFNNNKMILKRNTNTINIEPCPNRPETVVIEKKGVVISIAVNGKTLMKHIDETPFYGDYASLTGFGLYAPVPSRYTDISIETATLSFDYEKLKEFRRLVRLRNDNRHYYDMRIIPGEYRGEIYRFLFLTELGELIETQERMIQYRRERDRAIVQLQAGEKGFYGMIGHSQAMEQVFQTIKSVSRTDASVLITGETGTGKELAAAAIHGESGRKGPLIKVDCASLPPTLIESELFGHEKGAFTGAESRHIGKFEQAHAGTLFLDEIGNIPLSVQVKLLRFLQDRKFERLGGKETLGSDVRIICATNADLGEHVRNNRFRADLYYRINVITIAMPSLRQRLMDINILVNHFIMDMAQRNNMPVPQLSNDLFPVLIKYDWPGNVRELKNAVEHAVIVNNGVIGVKDLPPFIGKPSEDIDTSGNNSSAMESALLEKSTGKHTRAYQDPALFKKAFKECGERPYKIAVRFGCSYVTIKRYMKKYGLLLPANERLGNTLSDIKQKTFSAEVFRLKLGIAMNTARKYLAMLEKEGKITKERNGRFVTFRRNVSMA